MILRSQEGGDINAKMLLEVTSERDERTKTLVDTHYRLDTAVMT